MGLLRKLRRMSATQANEDYAAKLERVVEYTLNEPDVRKSLNTAITEALSEGDRDLVVHVVEGQEASLMSREKFNEWVQQIRDDITIDHPASENVHPGDFPPEEEDSIVLWVTVQTKTGGWGVFRQWMNYAESPQN